jgi:hypothetical protein
MDDLEFGSGERLFQVFVCRTVKRVGHCVKMARKKENLALGGARTWYVYMFWAFLFFSDVVAFVER